jgi:hypothetical protein
VIETSLAPELGVREARDAYLAANGFTVEGYTASHFEVDVLRVWRLPNPRARRRVIPLHDLQHVVTGYGTDLVGEAEQSAWELRGGINSWFLWLFKLGAVAIGMLIAPRRVLRALGKRPGQRTLYVGSEEYEAVLSLRLGELRERLGVPSEGLADRPARRHRRAPR